MKNILLFIITITLLQSCRGPKKIQVTNYGEVTLYAKITENWYKAGGSMKSDGISYRLNKADSWPDTMYNEHVKVTGKLKVTEYEMNDQYQMFNLVYLIKKPKIEPILDDSIIAIIDSANGDCVEMTRFIKKIQKEHVLDSIFTSVERINFIFNDSNTNILAGYDFYKKGYKTISFIPARAIPDIKEREYFIISDFPCEKDSEYEFDLIYVNEMGNRKEVVYHVSGNHKKIIIDKVR